MRRSQRRGDYLATDDTTGFTRYASQLRLDYWGNRTQIPLKRNLQEIAYPLDDPTPVPFTRGPSYELSRACVGEIAPSFVGNTSVPTNPDNAAFQALHLNPSIPFMAIGCSFVVR